MRYLIQKDGNFGFINEDGHIVIEPIFEQILGSFEEGLCPFSVNGKIGFIDEFGYVQIEPQFDEAMPFSFGITCVRKGEKWGYIGKTGETLIPFIFDDATGFDANNLAIVEINGKQGYIDRKGNFVIEPRFDSAYFFDGPLAKVILGGKIGYIDISGRLVWIEEIQTGAGW